MATLKFSKQSVSVPSNNPDIYLDAWLYKPVDSEGPFPTVVAGPGLTVIKEAGFGTFGEEWAAIGWASLIFDYKGFGSSGSTEHDKDVVSLQSQIADYQSLVQWAGKQSYVNATKIVLLGTAFSGLVVATLALRAKDEGIAGVIAQCPLLDGYATLTAGAPRPRLLFWAAVDYVGSKFGLPPVYIQAVAKSNEFGFLNSPSVHEGFTRMYSLGSLPFSKTPNRVAPRVSFEILGARLGLELVHVQFPFLVVMPEEDDIIPPAVTREVVGRALGRVKLEVVSGGHFDVMPGGKGYTANLSAQKDFLNSLL